MTSVLVATIDSFWSGAYKNGRSVLITAKLSEPIIENNKVIEYEKARIKISLYLNSKNQSKEELDQIYDLLFSTKPLHFTVESLSAFSSELDNDGNRPKKWKSTGINDAS